MGRVEAPEVSTRGLGCHPLQGVTGVQGVTRAVGQRSGGGEGQCPEDGGLWRGLTRPGVARSGGPGGAGARVSAETGTEPEAGPHAPPRPVQPPPRRRSRPAGLPPACPTGSDLPARLAARAAVSAARGRGPRGARGRERGPRDASTCPGLWSSGGRETWGHHAGPGGREPRRVPGVEAGWRARGSGRELTLGPVPSLPVPVPAVGPVGFSPAPPSGPVACGSHAVGSPGPEPESAPSRVCDVPSPEWRPRGFSGKSRCALVAAISKLRFPSSSPGSSETKAKPATRPREFTDAGPRNSGPRGHGICVFCPCPGGLHTSSQLSLSGSLCVDTGEPRGPTGSENPGTPREGNLDPTRSPPRGIKWAPCGLGLAQTRLTLGAG